MLSGSCWARYAQGNSCLSWGVWLSKPISSCISSWSDCHWACWLLVIVWLFWGSSLRWFYWLPDMPVDITSNRQRVCCSSYTIALCMFPTMYPYTHGQCVLSDNIQPQCFDAAHYHVGNYIACTGVFPYDGSCRPSDRSLPCLFVWAFVKRRPPDCPAAEGLYNSSWRADRCLCCHVLQLASQDAMRFRSWVCAVMHVHTCCLRWESGLSIHKHVDLRLHGI